MSRLVFEKGKQSKFLLDVLEKLNVDVKDLADMVKISDRSFRDWIHEKTLGEKIAMEKLVKTSEIELPKVLEVREENWSGRINGRSGAIARMKIYGPPGNKFGRSKGGTVSQQRRKENPDYYRSIGCVVPREFNLPEKSENLAEFFGIVLGDGGLSKYQLTITLNSIVDKDYLKYVLRLSKKIFNYCPYVFKLKNANANALKFSGIELIDFLINNGLVFGNKAVVQIDVPDWIKKNTRYATCCLRGLVDTDGGAFFHKYKVNNKEYKYLKINFTNVSKPLLKFVYDTLKKLGFTPKYQSYNRVWLYGKDEVLNYFKVVGSSNYRLLSKLK